MHIGVHFLHIWGYNHGSVMARGFKRVGEYCEGFVKVKNVDEDLRCGMYISS